MGLNRNRSGWGLLGLTLVIFPAAAQIDSEVPHVEPRAPGSAVSSSGLMHIGLTITPPQALPSDASYPDPASLGHPATRNAVLCHSDDNGYHECVTPFRGRVSVSREVSDIRCVEGRSWGWREGFVWVDQGCGAVFVRVGAAVRPRSGGYD